MASSSSPEKQGRIRVWLIRIGIIPPPDGTDTTKTGVSGPIEERQTEEWQEARRNLRFLSIRRPPRHG